ncbi:MAG TPA: PmoA family protein [Acidimicrobiales bacterium]|jgi:hypothetical protein|nr:PmoA family protein [Acidimicrobiales bacterium]
MVKHLWTYVYDDTPKPHVHPLQTPGGRLLTRVSPPDHPWMRGLWFAVKFVDGVNFWEENPHDPAGFGIQRQVGPSRIDWVGPDGEVALTEQRTVDHRDLTGTAYALDWTTSLTAAGADHDVVLDRTPYTTWGGYGGLVLRGAGDWEDTRILLPDGSEHRRPEGIPAAWADLSNNDAGIAFLDHPDNPRHPVPWYGATRSRVYGDGWSNYLNAAFLFHEPMTLRAGQPLTFRYRVIVHDDRWDAGTVQQAWEDWTR